MPRQLTPEEIKIIRQAEEEGAQLYREGKNSPTSQTRKWAHIIKGALIFIVVFALFACIAYAVVSNTAH